MRSESRTYVDIVEWDVTNWMSNPECGRGRPVGAVFDHGVENRQQFVHTGGQGDLLRPPGRDRRAWETRMVRLWRMATTVAMYGTARTAARPPQMYRVPRHVLLSRFNGTMPTKAAISLCEQPPVQYPTTARLIP